MTAQRNRIAEKLHLTLKYRNAATFVCHDNMNLDRLNVFVNYHEQNTFAMFILMATLCCARCNNMLSHTRNGQVAISQQWNSSMPYSHRCNDGMRSVFHRMLCIVCLLNFDAICWFSSV